MELVILKTDALFFILIASLLAYIFYASKKEHLARPWRSVLKKPMAASALTILAFYLTVAILDSIHFHPEIEGTSSDTPVYSSQVVSLLDEVLKPINKNTETTYSAPFAIYSYSKESQESDTGQIIRDYPRLIHAGSHLSGISEVRSDLIMRSLSALGYWISAMAILCLILISLRVVKLKLMVADWLNLSTFFRPSPAQAAVITFAAVCLSISLVATVGPYYHILGTDKVGNDVLFQGIKGIRTGLLIGTLTTLIMLPFAIVLGVAAGYFRGWVDDAIQYLYTTLSSIPGVLLIAAAALMLEVFMTNNAGDFESVTARADLRFLCLCLILGVTAWTGLCRYLRAETLKLKESNYIEASRAFGVLSWSTISQHVLPNLMHIVMISIVLDFSGLVLAEAALTYIDIGVDPSMESWGNMINGARLELAREPVVWWSLFTAFLFMFVLVLAANVFGDAVRDAFDPRIRELD
ncbi:MAG: ABC transporter permease [Gammaproteobacteria bacterium]